MSALLWQEILLFVIAVVIGMLIGCLLRRWMSAKSTEGKGASSTAARARAASPAAGATAAKAASVSSAEAAAQAVAEDTNKKLAAEQAELGDSSQVDTSKADGIDESDRPEPEPAPEEVADVAEAPSSAVDTSKADGVDESDRPEDQDIDFEAEEKRIAATLAALPKDATVEQKADAVGAKPILLDAPRNGEADDLKRIKGVGKVIEGKLNNLGIHHFDQVANWSRDEVNWVTTFLNFKGRIDREEWIPQARGLMSASAAPADDAEVQAKAAAASKAAEEKAAKEQAEAKEKAEKEAAAKAAKEKAAKEKAEAEAKAKVEKEAAEKAAAEKAKADAEAEAAKQKAEAEAKAAADKVAAEKAAAEEAAKEAASQEVDLEAEEAKMAAALAKLPKDASIEDKANAVGKKPRMLKQARKAGADDLKRIKGVGKVIEGKLNNLGVYHFDQIAKWNRDHINWVTTFLSFKGRIDRENWIEQAKLLAAGEETEFSKRVDKGDVESSK